MSANDFPIQESLDPKDWQRIREQGRMVVDDALRWLEGARERPAWRSVPVETRRRLEGAVPMQASGFEATYQRFLEDVLPYPSGSVHPRYWGWVFGTGTVDGALADFLASVMNSNPATWDQSACLVEVQVLDWLKDLLGYPRSSGAVLTSGCSMSTVIGLAAARTAKAPFDIRRKGWSATRTPLTLYASDQTHNSVTKAVELLGFGSDHLRWIPTTKDHRIDLCALAETIAEDRRRGYLPVCVIGNIGTVNTGAVDDIEALADICRREDLWLHIDGAFGALAWLCEERRPLLQGMQRADSLAFDLHKWMYMNLDVGGLIVRDPEILENTFAVEAAYLSPTTRGPAAHPVHFGRQSPELSRRFRSLKVWWGLHQHGADKFARLIRQNLEQAAFLARSIEAHPELELLAPAPLNVVCFRYRTDAIEEEAWNDLNQELLLRMQESGFAVPSHTMLNGRYALRVAITNHRSRRSDFEALVHETARWGGVLVSEYERAEGRPEWLATPMTTASLPPLKLQS